MGEIIPQETQLRRFQSVVRFDLVMIKVGKKKILYSHFTVPEPCTRCVQHVRIVPVAPALACDSHKRRNNRHYPPDCTACTTSGVNGALLLQLLLQL